MPCVVRADTNVNIGVTATGAVGVPPNAPTNFAVDFTDFEEDTVSSAWIKSALIWDIGSGATNTVIVRRTDRFPTSVGDGDLVYNGSGTSYDDTVNGTTIQAIGTVYYAAFSWNGGVYSAPATFKMEVDPVIANAIMLIGVLFICLFLSGMGYYFKKVPIVVTACLIWLGTGAWAFTQRVDPYDIFFFIGCVGIIMGLISAFEPWVWMVREETKTLSASEREAEIDERLHKEWESGDKQHKRRRRLP
jgi:hypothetical protein